MTLRVTLEIVPRGDETRKREIGMLDISQHTMVGWDEYEYEVIDMTPLDGGVHTQRVYHPQSDGAWSLVKQVLTKLKITGP